MRRPAVALHERIDRTDETEASSDRSFGLTFAAVGAALALWPLLNADSPRWWLLAAASALFAPKSGTETRRMLKEKADQYREKFGGVIGEAERQVTRALSGGEKEKAEHEAEPQTAQGYYGQGREQQGQGTYGAKTSAYGQTRERKQDETTGPSRGQYTKS